MQRKSQLDLTRKATNTYILVILFAGRGGGDGGGVHRHGSCFAPSPQAGAVVQRAAVGAGGQTVHRRVQDAQLLQVLGSLGTLDHLLNSAVMR